MQLHFFRWRRQEQRFKTGFATDNPVIKIERREKFSHNRDNAVKKLKRRTEMQE